MEENNMNLSQASFTAIDYFIFALLLILSSSVGVYYLFSDRRKPYKEYFLTNRSMPITPIAFSIMASVMSAITILGVAAESYFYGTQYAMISLGYVIVTPISAYVFLPVFYNMQTTSIFEVGLSMHLFSKSVATIVINIISKSIKITVKESPEFFAW
ncbi:putative sodium-dependent multivitamin transporter [Nephila pilipes]|uniref:Putative sodium-dependent multivitamin transporter n=1 Tax=Nephila pilipes TaxID=299642 RepID=A0A8X6TNF3_NEPPI|nr:putative sodium-dependent multivitamin transporter [Nephila pilipes]